MTIQAGSGAGGCVKGVVAPGTGLGEGFLVETNGGQFACGSEGGHVDFAPVGKEQLALLAWMQKKSTVVSYEMVISGSGLANIYDFYRDCCHVDESSWVKKAMQRSSDRTPVIFKGALADDPCPLCRRVVEMFLSILGSEAGNLALKVNARGGIYLGGGIIPRIKDVFTFETFLERFCDKGCMSSLLSEIPVHIILKPDAALTGAAWYGYHSFLRDHNSE